MFVVKKLRYNIVDIISQLVVGDIILVPQKCGSQKRKDTCIEKYGCENFVKTDNFKEKSQQTNLKKWGEKHFRQSEKWKINNGKNETCKRKNTQFKKFY